MAVKLSPDVAGNNASVSKGQSRIIQGLTLLYDLDNDFEETDAKIVEDAEIPLCSEVNTKDYLKQENKFP